MHLEVWKLACSSILTHMGKWQIGFWVIVFLGLKTDRSIITNVISECIWGWASGYGRFQPNECVFCKTNAWNGFSIITKYLVRHITCMLIAIYWFFHSTPTLTCGLWGFPRELNFNLSISEIQEVIISYTVCMWTWSKLMHLYIFKQLDNDIWK